MLLSIDESLYPSDCRVLEIAPCNLFVFEIFKNASSSLAKTAANTNGRVFVNEEIYELNNITIFVRQPVDRFVSGVQTVCYNIKKKYPELDENTIMFFLENYLFLDRHILPQFHWLLNLQRFANPNAIYSIRTFEEIEKISAEQETPLKTYLKVDVEKNKNNLYLQLDTVLYNLNGRNLKFNEIVDILKNDADAQFQNLINLSNRLRNFL